MAVSSLWNPQTGQYSHVLSKNFGGEVIDRVLRRLHYELFVAWLTMPLKQQQSDVAVYMGSAEGKSRSGGLQSLGTRCIPAAAIRAERELFIQDLGLVEALQRYDFEHVRV